jgi:hypothetical protein
MILHNWPDAEARQILERLREAATESTRLLIADFLSPLACPDITDDVNAEDDMLSGIEGAERTLASPPLLANLGKASSHVYWQDMTVRGPVAFLCMVG